MEAASNIHLSCIAPMRNFRLETGLNPRAMPAATTKPVLMILHQEHSTCGRVGQYLVAGGYALDIRRPRLGDPLPPTLAGHAGAVIFGGPMSANDTDDYIRQETEWLSVPLAENKPLLGICLGAQMLARHLGARVYPHPAGKAEVGYYAIRPTAAGRAFMPTWPDHVYQWHREGIELPAGAQLLAEGEIFPVQAFRFGTGFAIQFHPEVTHHMMCRWTTIGHERTLLPGAKGRAAHFADRPVYDPAVREWLGEFLARWIDREPMNAGRGPLPLMGRAASPA
jgi:GMP synthase (glutamine-hydrolysing)